MKMRRLHKPIMGLMAMILGVSGLLVAFDTLIARAQACETAAATFVVPTEPGSEFTFSDALCPHAFETWLNAERTSKVVFALAPGEILHMQADSAFDGSNWTLGPDPSFGSEEDRWLGAQTNVSGGWPINTLPSGAWIEEAPATPTPIVTLTPTPTTTATVEPTAGPTPTLAPVFEEKIYLTSIRKDPPAPTSTVVCPSNPEEAKSAFGNGEGTWKRVDGGGCGWIHEGYVTYVTVPSGYFHDYPTRLNGPVIVWEHIYGTVWQEEPKP